MKKIPFYSLFFLVTQLISINAKSQDIATDNEGKPIFTIPTTKKLVPGIALNNLGLSYTPLHLQRTKYYVMNAGVKQFTMYKSTTINIKGNIVNNDEDVLLIGKDMNITPHIELGVNRGFDALINPSRIKTYYTFSGAIFADFQHFDLYDTLKKSFLDKYRRTGYGASVSLNFFHRTNSAIAFNLSYRNSIVTDDLTSFQKKSANIIYVDNNIGTNGTTDGYLSPLSPSQNWRFSASFPQFLKGTKNLTLIPYYFIKFGEGITPKNNAGLMFTFLNENFRNFDNVGGVFTTAKTYTFETAFSVGLNLLSTGSEKHNYIFLSGTLSFGKTQPAAGHDITPAAPTANRLF